MSLKTNSIIILLATHYITFQVILPQKPPLSRRNTTYYFGDRQSSVLFVRYYVSNFFTKIYLISSNTNNIALRLPRIYFVHSLAALVLFRQGCKSPTALKERVGLAYNLATLSVIRATRARANNEVFARKRRNGA